MFDSLKSKVTNFLNDESGPTAVEYAVMLALIIAVCVTAIAARGTSTFNSFDDAATKISNFPGPGGN